MGYALIIDNCNFALPRIGHVTPTKEEQRVNNQSVSFAYGEASGNKMSLANIAITPSNGNEDFEFVFQSPVSGLSLDPISGTIYIYSEWASDADVTVIAMATRQNPSGNPVGVNLGSTTITVPAYISGGSSGGDDEEEEPTPTPTPTPDPSGGGDEPDPSGGGDEPTPTRTVLAHMSNTEDDTNSRTIYSNVWFYKYNGTWLWKFYTDERFSYCWYNVTAYRGKKMTIKAKTEGTTLFVTGFNAEPKKNTSQNHQSFRDTNWMTISQTFKKFEGEYFFHVFMRANSETYDGEITFTIPNTMKYILLRHRASSITLDYEIDIWEETEASSGESQETT